MENLTAVDGGAALIILVSSILAFSRGLVRELMAILGWIGAAVAGLLLRPAACSRWSRNCPWSASSWPTAASFRVVAAFAGVFAVGLIVAALFTPLFSGAVQRSALGGIDQALGFLFGAARGVLLIAVAFIVYDRVLSRPGDPDGRQLAHRAGLRQLPGQHRREHPRRTRRAGSSTATTS